MSQKKADKTTAQIGHYYLVRSSYSADVEYIIRVIDGSGFKLKLHGGCFRCHAVLLENCSGDRLIVHHGEDEVVGYIGWETLIIRELTSEDVDQAFQAAHKQRFPGF